MAERIKNFLKKEWWFSAALLLYSAFSLYRFFSQGPVNWDESYFLVPIRTYSDFLRTFFSHPFSLLDASYYREIMAHHGNIYTVAKPSFILSGVLIDFIWKSELSSRLVSFLAGLGVIFLLKKVLDFYDFGRFSKIASIFLLVTSPLFILFSRLGLAPIFSSFFLFLMFYQLLRFRQNRQQRELIIFSLSSAIAIMSHYSLAPVIGVFFLYAFYLLLAGKSSWKRYVSVILVFVAPIFAWEGVTRVGVWLAESKKFISSAGTWGIYSYFQEFINQLAVSKEGNAHFGFSWHFYYPELIAREDGWIILFLVLAGLLIFIFRAKKLEFQLALIPPLVFLIILSIASMKFPRTMMPIFPFLFIYLAAALDFFNNHLGKMMGRLKSQAILTAAVFLSIFLNLPRLETILSLETGFYKAADYIKSAYSQENTMILSSMAPAWRVFLSDYQVEDLNRPWEWQSLMAGKRTIVVSDHFTKIVAKQDYPFSWPSDKVFETPSTVFLSHPAVMDFLYVSADDFQKIFDDNKDFTLKIYEIK